MGRWQGNLIYVFFNVAKEKIEAAQTPLGKAIIAAAAHTSNLPADCKALYLHKYLVYASNMNIGLIDQPVDPTWTFVAPSKL